MQVLVIDDQFRQRAHAIREFASKPENVYRPGPEAAVPGDNLQWSTSKEQANNRRSSRYLTWSGETKTTGPGMSA